MLERTTQSKTANNVVTGMNKGTYSFDNAIQRGLVWNKAKKSELIYSMIYGYPVPQIFCKKGELNGKKIFDVLDGKQRLTTIASYINNEFALEKLSNSMISYEDDELGETLFNLDGVKFNDLPQEIRTIINEYNLNFVIYDALTLEQEREMFRRLNNGQQLSTKSKNLSFCKDLDNILEIGKNCFFESFLSAKARENKNQVTIIMKMLMMLRYNIDEISFESKKFNPFVRETILTEQDKKDLNSLLEYMDDIYAISPSIKNGVEVFSLNAQKKFMKETHLISLVPFMWKAYKEGISIYNFFEFVDSFFSTNDRTSISEAYNDACNGGSAKNTTIKIRHEELKKEFCKFFNLETEKVTEENLTEETGEKEETVESKEETVEETTEKKTEKTEETVENLVTQESSIEENVDNISEFPMNEPILNTETNNKNKKNKKNK